jgi:beta-phosphoglucomutase-like phosphatase (HAD superfamily)
MPLEALIFDVDGTLAETEELHRQSFNEAFAASGFDWTWDEDLYRKLLQITGGRERLEYFIDHWKKPQEAERARAHLGDLQADKSARYIASVKAGALVPRPGICRLIKEAHAAHVKLAIATTSLLPNVEALLRVMLGPEAPSWFTIIAAGDIVAHKKPAPDVYLYALKKLGCGARGAVAFEDSTNGLAAATAAGLATVVTPSRYLVADDFSLATSLVSDLGEPSHPHRHSAGWRFEKGFVDLEGLRDMVENVHLARREI